MTTATGLENYDQSSRTLSSQVKKSRWEKPAESSDKRLDQLGWSDGTPTTLVVTEQMDHVKVPVTAVAQGMAHWMGCEWSKRVGPIVAQRGFS